jgi:UTP--glucose-1-phosphate uridylyltransferase
MEFSKCQKKKHRYQVKSFVEKPPKDTAPSNLSILDRYVFTPKIFT